MRSPIEATPSFSFLSTAAVPEVLSGAGGRWWPGPVAIFAAEREPGLELVHRCSRLGVSLRRDRRAWIRWVSARAVGH